MKLPTPLCLLKHVFIGLVFVQAFAILQTAKAQEAAPPPSSSGWELAMITCKLNTPEDNKYKDDGGDGEIDKFEFIADSGHLRIAINSIHARHSDYSPTTILHTNTAYIAYRAGIFDENSNWDLYGFGGLGILSSSLRVGEAEIEKSDSFGYILGTGITYLVFENYEIGVQLSKISSSTRFSIGDTKNGSLQEQYVFKYRF